MYNERTVMANTETLSVVMCTYNGAPFLRAQLDTLLAQTRPADEIIVQDDRSTDGTWAILEEYAHHHPQIRIHQNATRQGVNGNFFSAIGRAQGSLIALCDQDDLWEPDKLAVQTAAIGDKLLCASRSQSFTDDGLTIETDPRTPNLSLLRMCYMAAFAGHTMLMRRQLLSLLPDVSEMTTCRMYDVILAMVAAAHQSISFVDRALVLHRRFSQAATYTAPTDRSRSPGNVARYLIRTLRLYHELHPQMQQRMAITHRFLGRLTANTPALTDALQFTALQSPAPSRWAALGQFVRLQRFCVAHCQELFHTPVAPNLLSRLRAAYFPISCSEYFRFLSVRYGRGKDNISDPRG